MRLVPSKLMDILLSSASQSSDTTHRLFIYSPRFFSAPALSRVILFSLHSRSRLIPCLDALSHLCVFVCVGVCERAQCVFCCVYILFGSSVSIPWHDSFDILLCVFACVLMSGYFPKRSSEIYLICMPMCPYISIDHVSAPLSIMVFLSCPPQLKPFWPATLPQALLQSHPGPIFFYPNAKIYFSQSPPEGQHTPFFSLLFSCGSCHPNVGYPPYTDLTMYIPLTFPLAMFVVWGPFLSPSQLHPHMQIGYLYPQLHCTALHCPPLPSP